MLGRRFSLVFPAAMTSEAPLRIGASASVASGSVMISLWRQGSRSPRPLALPAAGASRLLPPGQRISPAAFSAFSIVAWTPFAGSGRAVFRRRGTGSVASARGTPGATPTAGSGAMPKKAAM